jgi:hypothetical protein
MFVISLYQVMSVVCLAVTQKLNVSQNRAQVKVRQSKTARETQRRGIRYKDKLTVCTLCQVLLLVVKSRNTGWGPCTVHREIRRDVQCSAHVTKSVVGRPLWRAMFKVREHFDRRRCPNKSCTRIFTGLLRLSTWPNVGRL